NQPGLALVLQIAGEECKKGLTLRSEEHTSELQSRRELVCRLLLEKKNAPGWSRYENHPLRTFADAANPIVIPFPESDFCQIQLYGFRVQDANVDLFSVIFL